MIIISQPKLEVRENEVLVSSCIEDDKKHFRETIFYKTSAAYGPYAVTEKADLFVLSALMPALFSQSDIRVEGTLSSDLKYTLENGLIYILAKTYGVRPIKVHAERIETFEFGGKAVGAGCSMGVDSLATIKQHYIDDNRYGHKITHLAIFNTCEFGFEDANEANKLFRYEYSRAAAFARETGLELLYVQSNVTSLLNRYGTGLYDTCTLVHAAAILFLEKLYAVYYHSSGYLLDKLKYTTQSLEHFDFILFDMCSTRNTKIFSTLATQERTERTEYIIDDTLTKKYLHVCIKTIDDGPVHNCGRCYKCLRTLAAIDILGKLPEYETIFDQSYYKTHKAAIFAKYLGYRAADPFFADILNFAKQKGFRISKMAYLLSVKYYLLLPAYMLGRELPIPTKKKIKKFLRMKG